MKLYTAQNETVRREPDGNSHPINPVYSVETPSPPGEVRLVTRVKVQVCDSVVNSNRLL